MANPFPAWGYEVWTLLVLAWLLATRNAAEVRRLEPQTWLPLAVISLWGFAQLAFGATEYRWATANGAFYWTSLAVTAVAARWLLNSPDMRETFFKATAWFTASVAALSVLAYFTSEAKVLWIFPSPYPDVWGPFLSRNNFAQFLELGVPVALWLAVSRKSGGVYCLLAAVMLAAGVASASRAGAILLLLESLAVLVAVRRDQRKRLLWLAPAAAVCIAIAGAHTLSNRLQDPDPLSVRREIYHSTLAMISERPWSGFGIGTFSTVYPEFAEFDMGATVDHAHNDWAEWCTEGGLLFGAVWVIWFSFLIRPALRSVWGIGIIAVALHALVDYPFARHGVAAWLFVLAGSLPRTFPPERTSKSLRLENRSTL